MDYGDQDRVVPKLDFGVACVKPWPLRLSSGRGLCWWGAARDLSRPPGGPKIHGYCFQTDSGSRFGTRFSTCFNACFNAGFKCDFKVDFESVSGPVSNTVSKSVFKRFYNCRLGPVFRTSFE
jgi:hypothetical protein